MAWFKKKPDPISERERALAQEIAALESEIKRLGSELEQDQNDGSPRLRSTALPQGTAPRDGSPAAAPRHAPPPDEPIFEKVHSDRLQGRGDGADTPDHFNELGVRKYDLPALLRRIRNHFRGPATTNPKLVSYLAAGGIQGFRPLRYERRIARNRFLFFVGALFITLLGILLVFLRHR